MAQLVIRIILAMILQEDGFAILPDQNLETLPHNWQVQRRTEGQGRKEAELTSSVSIPP